MSTAQPAKRPFLLTLLGVIGMIQGIVTVISGIATVAERNDVDLQRNVDASSTALAWTGTYLIVLGVITIVVAVGLLYGSELARIVLTVVELFHIGGGVYIVIFDEGDQRWDGVAMILVALVVIWILYRARSEEFFESRSAY